MVRIYLSVGLVINIVIMHLNVPKERKNIKEIRNLEMIESVCMQMNKMIMMSKQ